MGLENLQLLKMEMSETSFCVENASAVSQFDIRANNLELTIEQQSHLRQHRVQRLTMHAGRVLGRKSAKLGFSVDMVGDGTALASSVTAVDDSLQLLLKRCLGGSFASSGSVVDAANTSKQIIPVEEPASFKAGSVVMIESCGTGDVNELRPVESVGASAIKLAIETTATAVNGARVWNSYSAYIDPSATSTMQAQILGDDSDDDVYMALGVIGGVTFDQLLQTDDVAKAVFDLMVTKWETDTGTIAAGSYDGASPLTTTEEMEVHYQTVGTATPNKINVTDLQVTPNVTWTPFIARGSSDKEHVSEIVMTACKPTAQFTADNDDAFITAWTAQTEKYLFITFGRTAGSAWAIWLPRTILAPSVPQRAGAHEQTVKTVMLEALENDDAATTQGRSPIIVARV